jgi:uncharacterized membrane protein YgdD (TMEM256/DUF423 family)
MKLFILLGSLNMALAIAIGAFGAHGLTGKVADKMLATWNTGAHYQMVHALALMVIGLLLAQTGANAPLFAAAGWSILVGIVLFSGSLYAMVLTGVKVWGAITPIGGVAFIIGWILATIAAVKYFHS